MIKFFRHIRRSLIQENKMGKYFKYAIGEILLVVIGILIALQFNNWNEQRKHKQAINETITAIEEFPGFVVTVIINPIPCVINVQYAPVTNQCQSVTGSRQEH